MRYVLGFISVVLAWSVGACDDGGGAAGSGGAAGQGGGGGAFVTEGATVSLSCIDEEAAACTPPQTYQEAVAGTQLDQCNYWDETQAFDVRFIGSGSEIRVQIANFTGEGSYSTSEDGTGVVMAGSGNAPSDAVSEGIPEPCTITVQSNLADIQIPQTGDADLLDVALDVTCPTLRAGGVCDVTCTLSPATFSLSVAGCTVSQ